MLLVEHPPAKRVAGNGGNGGGDAFAHTHTQYTGKRLLRGVRTDAKACPLQSAHPPDHCERLEGRARGSRVAVEAAHLHTAESVDREEGSR